MSENGQRNGGDGAVKFDPMKYLQDGLKSKLRILRFEVNDEQLLAIEEAVQSGMQAKAQAHMLVATAPVFEWWAVAGLWPIYPEGWTVLIRRARVGVQPQAAAPPPKLAT